MDNYFGIKDEEIVNMAKSGDQPAFSEICERYKGIVRMKAKAYYIAGGDNDDIIQEGMIGLFNAVRDFKADKGVAFATFAGICIDRQIATAIRSASSKKYSPLNSSVPMPIDDDKDNINLAEDPENIIIEKEDAEGTEILIRENLSDFENSVFDMLLDERKYAEIADILGVSKKSVDNAIQRIKKKLKALKDY